MSFVEKAKEYLGSAFGNEKSGAKAGGIAAVVGLGAMGFLAGDLLGALVGLGVGLVAAPFLNDLVDKNTGDNAAPVTLRKPAPNGLASGVPDVAPQRPEVTVQPDATEPTTLSVGGRNFSISLPKVDALKRPWEGQKAEAYIDRIRTDTLAILKNPENKTQDVTILHKMVADRNKPYYQFMATVAGYHSEFGKYNATTRREMMKELGLDDKDSELPPIYSKLLDLSLDKSLLDDVRVREDISADKWNTMSAVEQLSYIEESMSKRLISTSKKYARLQAEMEAQDRKVPIDIDFSLSSGLNRLSNIITLGYGSWTAENRAKKALSDFFDGKPEHQHPDPLDKSRKIIIRDEKQAEDEFRSAMDALITEYDAKGQFGGEMAAAQGRELISIIIEQRRTQIEWNGIQATKQTWADSAERWLEDAKAFKTSLTDYAAKYADGARTNKDFTLVSEFTMPIAGNSNVAEIKRQLDEAKKTYQPLFDRDYKAFEASGKKGEFKTAADTSEALNRMWALEDSLRQAEEIESLNKRAQSVRQDMKAGLDAMRKATSGIRKIAGQLDNPNMLAWSAIDIERDIKSLPTFSDVSSLQAANEPAKKDTMLRGNLEKAAEDYNQKLAAFKADTGNIKANAKLRVAYESMAKELENYLRNAESFHKIAEASHIKWLQDIEKQTTKGTPMQGAEGFGLLVKHKRGGKSENYVLRGVKKDGKMIVTGISTFHLGGEENKTTWFGSDISDIARGIEFDPKTMSGIDAIFAKLGGSPTAMTFPRVQPEVLERARASVAFAPMSKPDSSFLPNNVMQFAKEMPRMAA